VLGRCLALGPTDDVSTRRLEALDRERLVERLDQPQAEYVQFGGCSFSSSTLSCGRIAFRCEHLVRTPDHQPLTTVEISTWRGCDKHPHPTLKYAFAISDAAIGTGSDRWTGTASGAETPPNNGG
jgi:hypothetical protein